MSLNLGLYIYVNATYMLLLCFVLFSPVLPQEYVDVLVTYVKELHTRWAGHAEYDNTRGACLAVEVITMFWGDRCPSYVDTTGKVGGDPAWLKLKWGVAIASRALDAWTAAKNNLQVDAVSLSCRNFYTYALSDILYRLLPTWHSLAMNNWWW